MSSPSYAVPSSMPSSMPSSPVSPSAPSAGPTSGALLLRRGDRVVWFATALLAASTVLGYVLSRTTGLPGATDDIGNWLEPLGVASLFVEGVVVLLAGTALAASARD